MKQAVTPAEAGVYELMDSGFRRNDGKGTNA